MKNTSAAYEYHDRTKHRPSRYAPSLGYMDWAIQPDPFRTYPGTPRVPLVHDKTTPPFHLLFAPDILPRAPLCRESLSQLLRYSLGLAAIKRHGGSEWALRCNASSGNLHPSECYVVSPPLEGISGGCTLSHYAPREHALEILHTYDTSVIEGGFLILLSSAIWREMWKYGERSWRYAQLDAGHAYASIKTAASMLGWECGIVPSETADLAHRFGLDQPERFHPEERESPDLLIRIAQPRYSLPSPPLLAKASRLSPSHHRWDAVWAIDEAASGPYPQSDPLHQTRRLPAPSKNAGEVILKRRSAQAMDGSSLTETQFRQILDASFFCTEAPDVDFIVFVHRVEGLESGLYAYVRNPERLIRLRDAMDPDFDWLETGEGLYRLNRGDYRGAAQYLSCNQTIARDGAFSFGMLCRFDEILSESGAAGYKNLYHQCGMIGQMLYLEAASLNLSATGIGCFLDDEFHTLLGLSETAYQSLYHFTVGRAIVDTRITTLPPY
ncbi:MAG: SagB/ThcOx family dehydrogenase [Campylobacterota bacterium]